MKNKKKSPRRIKKNNLNSVRISKIEEQLNNHIEYQKYLALQIFTYFKDFEQMVFIERLVDDDYSISMIVHLLKGFRSETTIIKSLRKRLYEEFYIS